MATNFPSSLDALTNPQATDNTSTVDHAAQHTNANDAIEALQAKVGADSSAVTTSHDHKLSGVTGSDVAASLTGAETLTNKSIDGSANTITNIGNAEIEASAAIDASKIADGSVSNTEFQHLNTVTSNVQTQLDAKANTSDTTADTDTTLAGKSWFLDEDDMVSDDATKTASQQSIKAYVDSVASGILTPTVNVYTSGTTWNKPSGLQYVVVEVQAGGAGGTNSGSTNGADGGGSGGYSKKTILAASLGSSETVTVGAAGGAGSPGATGGNSSFGTHATANGGTSSAGGTAASGDINITGGAPEPGRNGTTADGGGGRGADSILGIGGSGGAPTNAGGTASGYGAGGGGAGDDTNNGGSGSAGVVIVTEYSI